MSTSSYGRLYSISHDKTEWPNAVLRTAPDGSFLLTGFIRALGGMARIEFQARRGLYSVLVLNKKTWQEATVRVGRARLPGVTLVSARFAHSDADGGIKASALIHSSAKRVLRRELYIARDGKRRWDYESRLSDGSVIVGQGTRDKTIRLVRRRTDVAGALVWTTESDTHRTDADATPSRRSAAPATMSTIRTTRADGTVGTTRKLAWGDGTGSFIRAETQWSDSPDNMQSTSYTQDISLSSDGSQTTTTVTKFGDGSEQIVVSRQNPGPSGSTGPMTAGDSTHSSETTTVGLSADGKSGATSHESSSWTVHEDGSMSGTWERSVTDSDGNTTTERGAAATDADGNVSVTTSHVGADGSVIITTTTTDSDGNGTEHTTTTDKDGNTTDTTTETHGDTGPVASGGSGGGDGDGGGDGHDGDNGGDDGDHGGGGSDSGMAWDGEGGSDEGPRSLPIHAGHAMDDLDAIARHGGGDDWGEGISYSERIGQAIASGAFSPEAGGGDTGWGDASSGEAPETFPRYGAGIDLSYSGPPAATDDWGDVKDPRAMVALIASHLDSLAHTSALAASSDLARATLVNRTIGARIGQVLARNQG